MGCLAGLCFSSLVKLVWRQSSQQRGLHPVKDLGPEDDSDAPRLTVSLAPSAQRQGRNPAQLRAASTARGLDRHSLTDCGDVASQIRGV